jgi:dTDP-4-dehydrorhamnose 3,5-epimerase
MIPAMPIVRDEQTVTPEGQQVASLLEGMVVRDLVTHTDERGTVCELFDLRWAVDDEPFVYVYQCTIRPGTAKGWAIHRHHDDRYALLSGEMELALYDAREDSTTYGQELRLVLSELHRRLVTIPAGVWHAERNLGPGDVRFLNMPTQPYDHEHPDKYRLPLDTDELPVRLGPGWRGW